MDIGKEEALENMIKETKTSMEADHGILYIY